MEIWLGCLQQKKKKKRKSVHAQLRDLNEIMWRANEKLYPKFET